MSNRLFSDSFSFILPANNNTAPETGADHWCILSGDRILVYEGSPVVPSSIRRQHFPDLSQTLFLGESGEKRFWVGLDQEDRTRPGEWCSPRALVGQLGYEDFEIISRALQLAHWQQNHRYCCRCGEPASMHVTERAMVCSQCSYHQYPRVSPCIIVLVYRDDEVLLARNDRFPRGMYSTLAGFIEAGESVEHALQREVMEEVGVEIAAPEYLGSQSWPFPHSLMLGFHARYAGGDIRVDGEEITEAAWWKCDELPHIPPKGAISRALIDHFVARLNL